MIMSDKKKPAMLILAKMKKGKEEEGPAPMKDGAEQDDSIGMDTAAEELLKAIESKDARALKEALVSLMDMYEARSEAEEDASEESEKA